jgi:flagellar biogenesis protein FliO
MITFIKELVEEVQMMLPDSFWEWVRFVSVLLCMAALIMFFIWFIPPFIKELTGTFQCKVVGDVSVCWSIK